MSEPIDNEPSVDALYEQVRAVVPAEAGDAPGALVEVAPGIRRLALRTPTLPPAAHTNTYLVGADRGPLLVIDPGSPYPEQQALLDRVLAAEADAGRPVRLVALTHHHGDHVGGAMAVADRWGIPIAAHPRTARRLAGQVAVTRELADGERIEDFSVTCVHTPGHADGHLCFERGEASVVGDMVAGVGWILIDPVEGDMADYLASLERLRRRAATTLLPAHGPAIADGPGRLAEYVAHRNRREERVVAALSARGEASLSELLPDAYGDTPRPLWPLAERSLRAHLNKLVAEGRARRVDAARWTCR